MNSISHIYEKLLEIYGHQGWWPVTPTCLSEKKPQYGIKTRTEKQKLEITLGTILTQNTAWKNAEKAIIELYKNDLIDKRKLLEIPNEDLAKVIRPSGYFNQKAKKIKELLKYEGPISRDGLLSVWGLGPETVDSILLYVYEKPEFVIDAYTKRMFSKYGIISENEDSEKIKKLFETNLKETYTSSELVKIYNEYHALIVAHGKKYYTKKPYGQHDPILDLFE